MKEYISKTNDMKDLFQWMIDHWDSADNGNYWYKRFTGKSKKFRKNQRRGL